MLIRIYDGKGDARKVVLEQAIKQIYISAELQRKVLFDLKRKAFYELGLVKPDYDIFFTESAAKGDGK